MENIEKTAEKKCFRLPDGQLCGKNCSNGCVNWQPNKRDGNGRQYCAYYSRYYFPSERQGCLSFSDGKG